MTLTGVDHRSSRTARSTGAYLRHGELRATRLLLHHSLSLCLTCLHDHLHLHGLLISRLPLRRQRRALQVRPRLLGQRDRRRSLLLQGNVRGACEAPTLTDLRRLHGAGDRRNGRGRPRLLASGPSETLVALCGIRLDIIAETLPRCRGGIARRRLLSCCHGRRLLGLQRSCLFRALLLLVGEQVLLEGRLRAFQ